MEENKENIIQRHTIEVSDGIKKLDLINLLLELEARQKNFVAVINEIKEVLSGQAAWSQGVDDRLQKLDPKIVLPGTNEFSDTVSKLK